MFPTTRIFCKDTCRLLAAASQIAYSKASEAEGICRERGAIFFQWIEDAKTDTQCFVAADFKNIVIAFRGSSSGKDWRSDLKVRRRNWNGYDVHRGFADGIDSVMPGIWKALQAANGFEIGDSRFQKQRVWICGHSLGGAEAMLCAFALRHSGLDIRVYTFGQPRVGDSEFTKTYDGYFRAHTFRVVNEKDIVTRVPALLAGYRHCGTEIFLDAFGKLHFDYPWWRKIPSDIWGLVTDMDPVLPVSSTVSSPFRDHFVEAYLKRLEKI